MQHTHTPNLEILSEIAAFCATSGISKSSFGSKSVGDPGLVFDLERKAREPRSRTVQAIRHFIRTGERMPKGGAQ